MGKADQEQAVKDAVDDISDDDDNKVNAENDEEQKDQEQEEEDEATIINSEKFENEFCAAIESIQIAAKFDREKMLKNAKKAYEEETGQQATDQMIINALKPFQEYNDIDGEDQEQQQNNIDIDDEEEEENDNDIDEEEENDIDFQNEEEEDVDVEDFEKEMNLALDNVKNLALKHQEEIVNKFSATFVEYNGVEPTVNNLRNIFGRIKQKFADEAADDFLDCNYNDNDDGDNDIDDDADSDYNPNDAEDINQRQQDQAEDVEDNEDDDEDDQDSDYDPNDAKDVEQAQKDQNEDYE